MIRIFEPKKSERSKTENIAPFVLFASSLMPNLIVVWQICIFYFVHVDHGCDPD